MQNSSPHQITIPPATSRAKMPPPNNRAGIDRRWLPVWLLMVTACTASAQTLARPGWNASGFNADPWWKRAVFYEVPAATSAWPNASNGVDQHAATTNLFDAVTANLGAAKSLGVDALILPMPTSTVPDATLDSFDELVRQASSRGIHVLLTLAAAGVTSDLSASARFWLSRGVSGFRIVTPPQTSAQDIQAIARALRKITSSAVGGRIVISDLSSVASAESAIAYTPNRARQTRTASASRLTDRTVAQLQIDSHATLPALPSAANLRLLLSQTQNDPNAILDLQPPAPTPGAADPYFTLAKVTAAIALTMRPAALIEAGVDLTPQLGTTDPALVTWYRQLIALHRGNVTLRSGTATTLDFDVQNALVWVIRPASNSRLAAPVVVACNLSAAQVRLSLGAAMKALSLHGFYLRTLLRTDKAMGAQDIDAVTLPPFGVYIGELRR